MFKQLVHFSIGPVSAAALTFVTGPVTTWLIAPEEFGKAAIFMTAIEFLHIVTNLGFDQGFIRFYNQCTTEEQRIDLFRRTIKLPIACNLAVSTILIIFWKQISLLLFCTTNIYAIFILVISITTGLCYYFTMLIIMMKQRGKVFSLLTFFTSATNSILIIVFALLFNKSFISVISAHMFSQIISLFSVIGIERKFWFLKIVNSYSFSFNELAKFSIPIFTSLLIFWFFSSISNLSLRVWSTFESLGLFAVSLKFISSLNLIQRSFSNFWIPVAYSTYAEKPEDTTFFEKVYLLICFTMFFSGTIVLLLKDIIIRLFHSEYRTAAMIMPFLLFMPMMYTISEITVTGINFKKQTHWHILIASVVSLINISLNYVMTPRFGPKGTAVATGLSYIVFFILRTLISQKYFFVNYHLIKSSVTLMLFSFYCVYSTVYTFNFYHILFGSSLLIFLIIQYFDTVMLIFMKVLSAWNIYITNNMEVKREQLHCTNSL